MVVWMNMLSSGTRRRKILNRSIDVFRVVMRGSTFLIGLIVLPVFACADKGDYTFFFRLCYHREVQHISCNHANNGTATFHY